MSKFAKLLKETIEKHGDRYIAELKASRGKFPDDDIDYAKGPIHVSRMTGIHESNLTHSPRPFADLSIMDLAALMSFDATELISVAREERTSADRINNAVDIIATYGPYDGAHHKQWAMDQAVRALLTPEQYEAWVRDQDDDSEYPSWDVGVAP